LRPAKPWQSNSYLRSSREDLSFDAAHWQGQPVQTFAEGGMTPHVSGFAADSYQPMSLPLSEQAQKAWALLDDAHDQQDFAEEKSASQDNSSTNAHLPFVLDVYQSVVPKSAQRGQAQTSVGSMTTAQKFVRDALAEPELAAVSAPSLDATPAGQDELQETPQSVDLEGHEDVFAAEAADMVHDDLDEAATDDAATEDAEQAAETVAEAPADPDAQAQAAGVSTDEDHQAAQEVPADAPDELAQPAADAADEAAADLSAEPEPTLPGLDATEVAQREAEQFALGAAQGKEEGMAQGLQEGLAQGQALGEAKAREAMAQEVAAQCELLAQVTRDLKALLADPKQFFEPLKRLSVHLAEQLVLGELSQSSQAIERLIQHCLDEVSHPLQDSVVVELNPDDKKRLQAQGGEFLQGLRLESVPELQPGSVRVFANDMVVEDLVEHRLQGLAKDLLSDVASWQKKSVLAKPDLSEDHTEHDDDPA